MVRVLVVEDEANIRDMIALNLRHAGMEVVEAEKRTAGSRIALDHEWRHYCYYNEDARTGHCSCGNSRI